MRLREFTFACVRACVRACICAFVHFSAFECASASVCMHACVRACVCENVHEYVREFVSTCACVCICSFLKASAQVYFLFACFAPQGSGFQSADDADNLPPPPPRARVRSNSEDYRDSGLSPVSGYSACNHTHILLAFFIIPWY